ncbi:hypothetical protein [Sphingomonas qomolangmaensis]|uniref:Lipocalin-like domain-containing protein n=1 Tax=Sphingomonas qomolangmaensis TaxID=2918765 RepID=A0ABY5LAD9_9SPHN|nr:hypothetical protein [Sphingomonas qomolangmaensis]UUL82759.1 hypothetical protein NMP03_00480 [Sphingomonas qomolangmaensis]
MSILILSLLLPLQSITPQALLASTAGKWRGELAYRDYQTDQWQGLPVEVTIIAQPDGVTTVRTAAYDDGPKTGTVWITTTAMVEGDSLRSATFREGRPLETATVRLTVSAAPDPTHWTMIAQDRRIDGDGMAQIRETTVRDGATMTTLKEVDPEGDGKDVWLPRNRTVLTRVD